jgi:hypothetical protein
MNWYMRAGHARTNLKNLLKIRLTSGSAFFMENVDGM